jgi:hypothetical protein
VVSIAGNGLELLAGGVLQDLAEILRHRSDRAFVHRADVPSHLPELRRDRLHRLGHDLRHCGFEGKLDALTDGEGELAVELGQLGLAVSSAARRSNVLSLAKTCSIGLRSGE